MKHRLVHRLIAGTTLGLLALSAAAQVATPTIQLTPEQRSRLLPESQVQLKKTAATAAHGEPRDREPVHLSDTGR